MDKDIDYMTVYIDGVYDERHRWKEKIKAIIKQLKNKIELCKEKEQDSAYFSENWDEANIKYNNQIEILRELLDKILEDNK